MRGLGNMYTIHLYVYTAPLYTWNTHTTVVIAKQGLPPPFNPDMFVLVVPNMGGGSNETLLEVQERWEVVVETGH